MLDVNETLFSFEPLQPLFDRWEISRESWFSRTLRTGFALTCMGRYRSFPQVAADTLVAMAPDRIDPKDVEALSGAFGQLEPHADVAPALARLHDAGVPVVTLSVGNPLNVERLFERAGLSRLVAGHLSCETVRRWKPAPEPYRHACEAFSLDPPDAWMVAAHAWDLGGAAAVGMRTAWVSRLEGAFDANFIGPDVRGDTLVDVVERLVGVLDHPLPDPYGRQKS